MAKEEKFYNALRDLFVGAKIEGESGFVNLMRIKSGYYSQIEDFLQKDIAQKLKPYPKFREELFDKLHSFFSRYFTRSGSIYFNQTPFYHNIYEKVYTDEKDVILFWKTHMLYYVKSDRIFNNLEIEFEEDGKSYKFFFDVSKLEHKRANEKRSLVFRFKNIRKDKVIVFDVFYSERGTKTKIDEIKRELKKKGVKIKEEVLERAFRTFEKQSEVDYFINKNAKEFLKEQFKLWLHNYIFEEEGEFPKERVNQLNILKDIAYKIIDFIAQFEDELVKIWNKPKFVRKSNYVITLDRIAKKDIKIIEKIWSHKNFAEQVEEWKELGILTQKSNLKSQNHNSKLKTDLLEDTLEGKRLRKEYQFLPIDTRYFKDLELEILGLFDNLDDSLDGWLIKSENYQALNTILPKFRERVQTIYIDPPFNKETDADYFYSVKYKDATWISLLENRLQLAKDLLNEKGSIFVRCDYNGNMYVRLLMNEIFGEENFRNEIDLKRTRTLKGEQKKFHTSNDTCYFYAKALNTMFFHGFKKLKEKPRWLRMHLPGTVKGDASRIVFGKKVYPPRGRKWVLDQRGFDNAIKQGLIKWNDELNEPLFLSMYETIGSDWSDIPSYTFDWSFQTENSEILLKRVIESTSNQVDLVMDFFLGSGTTTAVAHKLGKKWLGVEMGEHFYTVALPRMKKVLAYDKSGISREKDVKEGYNRNRAGGFFKYCELEQYEDTLRKVKYEDSTLFEIPGENPYQQYVFMKDKKLLDALKIDYKNNKVKVDLSKLYDDIDIAETLSNLRGKYIKKLKSQNGKLKSMVFEDGEEIDLENLDYRLIEPLIWW